MEASAFMMETEKTSNIQPPTSNLQWAVSDRWRLEVGGWALDVERFSWQHHKHFLQALQVGRGFDPRFQDETGLDRARIDNFSDGNTFGINFAGAAGNDLLAGLDVRVFGEV